MMDHAPTREGGAVGSRTDGAPHRLRREAVHTYWDNALPPRLTISPGDTVVFVTSEPSRGGVARDVASSPPPDAPPDLVAVVVAAASEPAPPTEATALPGHALTGPVAVRGAEPGDTLVVEVIEVVPGEWGWTACGPGGSGGGLLHDEFSEWVLHLWGLRLRDVALFTPEIRVPIAPFCGVMGVAPSEPGRHSTVPPGRGGGNLDIRQLTAGATLYLPVLVPDALFSVGDVHAAQGDGEVGGTGIETDAVVTLRFNLVKGRAVPGPQFLTSAPAAQAGCWFVATGHNSDLYEAAREALRGVLAYLQERHGLERAKACILASACVDLRISQLVNADVRTVSAFLPLDIFAGG
jgi:acetamidase/formamidase